MSANCQYTCSFTSGNTAADNHHLPAAEDWTISIGAFFTCLRIDGTVEHRIVLDTTHTAFLTGDAGTDFISFSTAELFDIIRVSQQRTSQRNDIAIAILQRCKRHIRIVHSAGKNNRHIDCILYQLCVGAVKALFLIHRRMAPPPCIVGTDVNVQRIVTILNQQFCRFDTFRQIASHFGECFTGQGTDSPVLNHALGAETQRDNKVLTASGLNFFDDFFGKTQTIFQTAAVFVGAVVKHRNCELVQQVPFMNSVNLYAVKTGTFGIIGTQSERFDDFMNLFNRQFTADFIQPSVRNRRRSDRRILAQIGRDGNPSKTGRHLQKYLCTISVNPLGHFTRSTGKMNRIVCRRRTVGHAVFFYFIVHKSYTGNNQSGAAFSALGVVIDATLIKAAICVSKSERTHRSESETVFQLNIADTDRRKQLLVLHFRSILSTQNFAQY